MQICGRAQPSSPFTGELDYCKKKVRENVYQKIKPDVCFELAFKGCLKWNTQCIPTRSQLMNKLLNKVNMEIELWNMLWTLCVSDHTLSKYPGVLYVYKCVSVCIEPSADAEGCFSPWNCNIILTFTFAGKFSRHQKSFNFISLSPQRRLFDREWK